MCYRYRIPERRVLHLEFDVAAPPEAAAEIVVPGGNGVFVRAAEDGRGREARAGRWQIVPPHAQALAWPYRTHRARWEKVPRKQSFRAAWAASQRCIVPAAWFLEPNHEDGGDWWRLRRADGRAFGLAGLWNAWRDARTGLLHDTYAILTQNADASPLMRRLHPAPPPARPGDAAADRRAAVVLEPGDWDAWLHAPADEAAALVRLAPDELFTARPEHLDDWLAELAAASPAPPASFSPLALR